MKCFSVEQQRKAQIIEFFYTKNELVKFNNKKKKLYYQIMNSPLVTVGFL